MTQDGFARKDAALDGLRSTLAADDYRMDLVETDAGRVEVLITAGPDACADCLVPKAIMRNVLQDALGVPSDKIVLHYPADEEGL